MSYFARQNRCPHWYSLVLGLLALVARSSCHARQEPTGMCTWQEMFENHFIVAIMRQILGVLFAKAARWPVVDFLWNWRSCRVRLPKTSLFQRIFWSTYYKNHLMMQIMRIVCFWVWGSRRFSLKIQLLTVWQLVRDIVTVVALSLMRLHGVDVYSHDLSLFIIGFYTGPNLLPYEFEVKCTAENSTCLADSEGELVSGVLPDALSYVTATVTGLDSNTTFWCYVLSVIKSGRVCQGPFVGRTKLPYVTWSYVGSPGFSAGSV